MDPIDREDFSLHRYRPPDAATIARLRQRASAWRGAVRAANDLRAELNAAVIDARNSGHSFAQIREATGLGTMTIQQILHKANWGAGAATPPFTRIGDEQRDDA